MVFARGVFGRVLAAPTPMALSRLWVRADGTGSVLCPVRRWSRELRTHRVEDAASDRGLRVWVLDERLFPPNHPRNSRLQRMTAAGPAAHTHPVVGNGWYGRRSRKGTAYAAGASGSSFDSLVGGKVFQDAVMGCWSGRRRRWDGGWVSGFEWRGFPVTRQDLERFPDGWIGLLVGRGSGCGYMLFAGLFELVSDRGRCRPGSARWRWRGSVCSAHGGRGFG